jgi:hypothetical protein
VEFKLGSVVFLEASGLMDASDLHLKCSSKKGNVFPIVLVTVATIVGAWFALVGDSSPTSTESIVSTDCLVVPQDNLKFGTVLPHEHFVWSFPVTNTTQSDIEVSKFHVSCDCTTIEPPNIVVRAGQTALLRAIMDLSASEDRNALAKERLFNVVVMPEIKGDDAARPVWKLHGVVEHPITLTSQYLVFNEGDLVIGKQFVSKALTAACRSHFDDISAECDPDLAMVLVQRLPEEAAIEFRVHPAPRLRPGHYVVPVIVRAARANGEAFVAARFTVIATVIGRIGVSPELVSFGITKCGDSKSEVIRFHGQNNAQVSVKPTHFKSACLQIIPNNSYDEFVLQLSPPRGSPNGSHREMIEFEVSGENNSASYTISVPVTYYLTSSHH